MVIPVILIFEMDLRGIGLRTGPGEQLEMYISVQVLCPGHLDILETLSPRFNGAFGMMTYVIKLKERSSKVIDV